MIFIHRLPLKFHIIRGTNIAFLTKLAMELIIEMAVFRKDWLCVSGIGRVVPVMGFLPLGCRGFVLPAKSLVLIKSPFLRVVCEGSNGTSCPERCSAVGCGADLPEQRGIREQRSEQGRPVNLLLTLLNPLEVSS